MTINFNKDDRAYFSYITDSDKIDGVSKGFHCHWDITGNILSCIGLAFKDEISGKWFNKKSVIHYLQRNEAHLPNSIDKAQIKALTEESTPDSVQALFTKTKVALYEPTDPDRQQLVRDITGKLQPNIETLLRKQGLTQALDEPFSPYGLSFQDIQHDDALLLKFLQDPNTRQALLIYAQKKQVQKILDKHLEFVSQEIFDRRDDLSQGLNFSKPQSIYKLMNILRGEYRKTGRSLSEVFNQRKSCEILLKSARLSLALNVYFRLQNLQDTPKEKNPVEQREEEAVRRGVEDASKGGVVTQLGLNHLLGDEAAMKKAVLRLLQKGGHKDKNPNANEADAQAATFLNQLLAEKNFKPYREALENKRKKG